MCLKVEYRIIDCHSFCSRKTRLSRSYSVRPLRHLSEYYLVCIPPLTERVTSEILGVITHRVIFRVKSIYFISNISELGRSNKNNTCQYIAKFLKCRRPSLLQVLVNAATSNTQQQLFHQALATVTASPVVVCPVVLFKHPDYSPQTL
jgi:hypothetical protein